MIKAVVSQGEGGRWRWKLVEGDEVLALSPVRGWDSPRAAWAAVRRVEGGTSPDKKGTVFLVGLGVVLGLAIGAVLHVLAIGGTQ